MASETRRGAAARLGPTEAALSITKYRGASRAGAPRLCIARRRSCVRGEDGNPRLSPRRARHSPLQRNADIASGITALMRLLCDAVQQTRRTLTEAAPAPAALISPAGPPPLAVHAFRGRPAPVERPWAILSEFIVLSEAYEAAAASPPDAPVRLFLEAGGAERLAAAKRGAMRGVELVAHVQAVHARARLRPVPEYLEARSALACGA